MEIREVGVRVLMIGLNSGYLEMVGRGNHTLHVVEEPAIFSAVDAFSDARITETRTAAYQQSDEFLDIAAAWHCEEPFDVVVPGMEYAVPGAARLAERIGLRSPGVKAAEVLCDKHSLRDAAARLGISQPRYQQVRSTDDIRQFLGECSNAGPVVLKPSNRRASVGVLRIENADEVDDAFAECAGADEGYRVAPRAMAWRYLVEEYVPGLEVSVESLWSSGRPIFENVTLKDTVDGRYFTEVGHVVPAPTEMGDDAAILAANRTLLGGLGVLDGAFHSEWKLDRGRAVLIECAARLPGDLIPQLIGRAYGFDLYEALCLVLAGTVPDLPTRHSGTAGVRFLRPAPGRVRAIRADVLTEEPAVFDHFLRVEPGDLVDTFENSWHRAGYFAVTAADHESLAALMRSVERRVVFEISSA